MTCVYIDVLKNKKCCSIYTEQIYRDKTVILDMQLLKIKSKQNEIRK